MDEDNKVQQVIDKIKKKSNFLKWGLGLAGLLILTPLIWALAYAVLGAAFLGLSLALAAAVGAAIITFTPVLMMKLENKKIQMVMDEATKNPIPTMWAEWQKDGDEIEAFRKQIVDFETAVESSFSQVKKLSKDMTAEDMANFQSDYEAQKADVTAQYVDLAELEKGHKQSEIEIKRLNAVWESANAMSKANAMNMATRKLDAISAIKRDTAFKSVMAANAHAKAQMRARIEQRKSTSTPQLTNDPAPVIPLNLTQRQEVAR